MRLIWIGVGIVAASAWTTAAADETVEDPESIVGTTKNGLSSEAFRSNALTVSPEALEVIRTNALNNDLFSVEGGLIAGRLRDPNARAVAEEMIKCALRRGTKLSYASDEIDAATGQPRSYTWEGELGLCQPPAEKPDPQNDWSQRPPTKMCQQLVTACVISRVNALQKAIPLSLRGQPAEKLPVRGRVWTEPTFREGSGTQDPVQGTPIPSFGTTCGPDQECNWRSAYVGKCKDGQIELELPAPAEAASTQLRVCAGIHGCTKTASSPFGPEASQPRYHFIDDQTLEVVGSSVGPQPGVQRLKFSCPKGVPVGSYYSVMIRRGRSPSAVKQLGGPGTYPATEQEVFTFLEGAFYGNLFEPEALLRSCEVVVGKDRKVELVCGRRLASPGEPYRQGSGKELSSEKLQIDPGAGHFEEKVKPSGLVPLPYGDVHACYSLGRQADTKKAQLGVAYLNSRLCAGPTGSCFAQPPKPCEGKDGAGCKLNAAGFYEGCKGQGTESYVPITTYLNEACDLIGEGGVCKDVRALSEKKCGGGCCCRRSLSCSTSGALALSPALVVLALVLRRRRRPRAR